MPYLMPKIVLNIYYNKVLNFWNMTNAFNITDEELLLLKNYLIKNASFLASENRISLDDYYANDNKRKWTIIDVPQLGEIRIYITDCAKILKINGIEVLPKSRSRDIDFFSVHFPLRFALKDIDSYKNNSWLNKDMK
jgi:hypothetical protein